MSEESKGHRAVSFAEMRFGDRRRANFCRDAMLRVSLSGQMTAVSCEEGKVMSEEYCRPAVIQPFHLI